MPPRRHPRVAALVPSKGRTVLLVLDAWEVRAVVIRRTPSAIKRHLLAERPAVLVLPRKRPTLAGLNLRLVIRPLPTRTLAIDSFPELRRFARSAHARAVRQALTLAFNTLAHLAL